MMTETKSMRTVRVLWLALLGLGVSVFSGVPAWSAPMTAFDGAWIYETPSGDRHVANVTFAIHGAQVTGTWGDGSARGSGGSGKITGAVEGGRLVVRLCGDDDSADYPVCPDYQTRSSNYFTLDGADLVWFRKDTNRYKQYVVLHRQDPGR
jgi:hypothetical protein